MGSDDQLEDALKLAASNLERCYSAEAERDRLRAALEVIAAPDSRPNDGCQACPADALGHIARLALDGHPQLDGSGDMGETP